MALRAEDRQERGGMLDLAHSALLHIFVMFILYYFSPFLFVGERREDEARARLENESQPLSNISAINLHSIIVLLYHKNGRFVSFLVGKKGRWQAEKKVLKQLATTLFCFVLRSYLVQKLIVYISN